MPYLRPLALVAALIAPTLARSAEYAIEPLNEAAPDALAAEVRDALSPTGYRVTADGKPFLDIWLRKAVPASAEPAGPKGAVLFPFLGEGELLGAVRYAAEGFDYRDQSILEGVYTIRYGLQPVNGNHLGVSPNRDYALLVPADIDKGVDPLPKEDLEKESSEAAGTAHPAVLMLLAAPDGAKGEPAMNRNKDLDTWGAVVPLSLKVGEGGESSPFPVQLVVEGAAPV
jgi:hypothetical protein